MCDSGRDIEGQRKNLTNKIFLQKYETEVKVQILVHKPIKSSWPFLSIIVNKTKWHNRNKIEIEDWPI